MKGAIASVELFAWARPMAEKAEASGPRRLTLVVGTPARSPDNSGWTCRVALADLQRPVEVAAADSVGALSAALAQGEVWLDELRGEGIVFTRDRAGKEAYVAEVPVATIAPVTTTAPDQATDAE